MLDSKKNMKMKKIVLLFASIFTMTSCSDFLDEPNENYSNNPPVGNLTPAQMLAAAQLTYLNHEVISVNTYGNKMTYTYGLNGGYTSSDVAYNYLYTANSYDFLFENGFLYTANFQDVLNKTTDYPEYQNHFAIAKIMKAQGLEKLINLYGDVPYTEAFNKNIITPAYEDDKQIIMELINLLEDAREDIIDAASNPDAVEVGGEDIVFGGDMESWYYYVNTLELRMLLRLSNVTDADLVAFRNDKFATLPQAFITSDVTFNPGFTGATATQSNPMFRLYGVKVDFSGYNQSYLSTCAGKFIGDVLSGTYSSSTLQASIPDPRRTRMFVSIGGVISGAVQNNQDASAILYSRLAPYVTGFASVVSTEDAYNNGSERDAYVMLAAESYFLQAEAIQRGYMSGDAQSMFNQGITASFEFYSAGFGSLTGLYAPLNASSYISNIDGLEGLGWTGSTDKINAIMTQKWLALAQWTGIEPYFDMLRTGYPAAPLPFNVTQTNRPNRLIYPNSEYTANSANVPSVTSAELFTVNSKTPYYLQ